MRKNPVVLLLIPVFAIAMSFIFIGTAISALETQLAVDASASTDNVPYQQTNWYGFSATAGKGYCVTLTPLTGNSDQYFFDTNFSLVGSSKNTGTTQDKVWFGQATNGPMHVGCFGVANPSSNLTIQVISAPYVKTISPASGGTGTLVTLTGFGFGATQGSNYVMFGSVKATSYTSWSNTQIKVSVPLGVTGGAIQAVVYVSSKASNLNNFTSNVISSDGTMYMYDLGRTSSFPNGPTVLPLNLKWTYSVGSDYITQPPIIANNIAYIYTYPYGKLLAVDITTGLLKWSYSRTNFQSFNDIPVVAGGTLYMIGNDSLDGGMTYSNILFAFDANTGSLKWKYNTQSQGISSNNYSDAAIFNNIVYFALGVKVYAVDAVTGILKWTYTATSEFSTHCAISNGVVYVGSRPISNGSCKVYALDVLTGAVKWIYTIPEVGKCVCGISVANGVVYFGTYGSGTWVGSLYALDANTGSVKWKKTGYIDVRVVGVVNGIVYANVNSGGWHLQAFDANTGVFKWFSSNYNTSNSDLGISNGLVFASSATLEATALNVYDAATGVLKWGYSNFGGYMPRGPFICNGKVYVCSNNNLYCLGQ